MPLSRLLVFCALASTLASQAPAPDLIPPSGVKFERLNFKGLPAYRPLREEDGSYSRLTRKDILAELRMITSLELNERGTDLLPPPLPRISCRYESYSAVDQTWAVEFAKWYRDKLWKLNLTYRKEEWDCDDFSMALNAYADLALLRSKDHPPPQLIGRLVVRQAHAWAGTPAGGVHELVIYRSGRGWHVFEPQTSTNVTLWEYPNRTYIREILFN